MNKNLIRFSVLSFALLALPVLAERSGLVFQDMSTLTGLVTPPSWKYGGPCVFDANGDGRYDFVLGNHDQTPIQHFIANPDNTYTEKIGIMWRDDVHGIAAGDYDGDGDNDVLVAVGGGCGASPKPPRLLRNDGDRFQDVTVECGISEMGARGRSVRWIDLDMDGDLDLLQINAAQVVNEEMPRNLLYENMGDGTFKYRKSPIFEDINASKVLVTDFDGDHIPDLITFGDWEMVQLWKGNNDFTFENVSETWLPEPLRNLFDIKAVGEADIDNDGDPDYYLARGGHTSHNCASCDDARARIDLRHHGKKGRSGITFYSEEWRSGIDLIKFDYMPRGRPIKELPIFYGAEKLREPAPNTQIKWVGKDMAKGFPEEVNESGWYIGYLGDNKWRLEWNLNDNVAWYMSASIIGAEKYEADYEIENPERADVLLRNDGGAMTDISAELPEEMISNNTGVTPADFDNDGDTDFFIYRYGPVKKRVMDVMLLNQGDGTFVIWDAHGATDLNEAAHGDMGCALDYDLDGWADVLSGDDDFGSWHLFRNEAGDKGAAGNHLLVQVGYSANGTDPIGAEIRIKTGETGQFRAVGSGSSAFSQNQLNICHFGLGDTDKVTEVEVRWRDGATEKLENIDAGQVVKIGK